MIVRPARIDDVPALARVLVDSWRAAYRELVPGSYLQGFNYEWREESFRESLATGAEETFVVQLDRDIAGFLTLGTARDPDLDSSRTGEIWGIYLSPGHWRRGVGKKLVWEAERVFKSRGYESAVLWVLERNEQARRFFEAVGFNPEGETIEIDWGILLRAVRYVKNLESATHSIR